MKYGTVIEVEGRGIATIIYSGLDGFGIIWGQHNFSDEEEDLAAETFSQNMFSREQLNPHNIPEPEAMLRDKYLGAVIECVGDKYRIVDK